MRIGAAVVMFAACGGADDAAGPAEDAAPVGCDRSCLVDAWIEVTGSCAAICSLSPMPVECAAADCQQTNFNRLAEDGSYVLWFSAYSASSRSFTLFTATPGNWALPSSCHLTMNASTDPDGNEFSCVGDTVDLPARDWTRMAPELEQAVVTASGGSLPAHGTY
jgi:hypothetical protein